jgi:Putative adhesin
MSEEHPPDDADRSPEDRVRTESWACDGPAVLDADLDVGRIEITLVDELTSVELELRADPERGRWSRGLSGLFNRLGEATGPGGSIRIGGHDISLGGHDFLFGRQGFDLSALSDLADVDLAAEAVRATAVSWTGQTRRLVVHSPNRMPLRMVPLVLAVRAPSSSRLGLRTGMGRVVVTGRSGHAEVHTGSGDVELDMVDGDLRLDTGSGAATARSVSGRSLTKTGSGNLTLDALDGPAVLKADSGDIQLGAVRADVQARTGSGDLTVADAERGRLDLNTGSGDLRIAVHAGVAAELNLTSGSGRARSELTVSDTAPPGDPAAVVIQGRTGSGDVLVSKAGAAG